MRRGLGFDPLAAPHGSKQPLKQQRAGNSSTASPIAQLDELNLDRVIAAVTLPVNNPDGLRTDLEAIANLYRTGSSLRWQPAKRARNSKQIIATAKRLYSLIEGNWYLHRYRPEIERLIAEAKRGFPVWFLEEMLGVNRVSAFEAAVRHLALTFELHFKVKPGYTKKTYSDSGEIEGPFIDFADAALRELEIRREGAPYTRNSIAAALTKVSSPKM
jgi:hypothetical protein